MQMQDTMSQQQANQVKRLAQQEPTRQLLVSLHVMMQIQDTMLAKQVNPVKRPAQQEPINH